MPTPWYLNPAIRPALTAAHQITGQRDMFGDWHYSIATTTQSRAVHAAWEAAYYATKDDPAAFEAAKVAIQPEYLMAAIAGVTPYEWRFIRRAAQIAAAAVSVRLAAGERIAA